MTSSPRRLLHRAARRSGHALLLLAASVGACGDREAGGGGRFEAGVLVLEGSPREMGWWHGRLLADRIRRLHDALQRAALEGASAGDSDAAALRSASDLHLDRVLPLLPERLRQELDGLAEGSGLSARELLRTEVLRDAMRFHRGSRRLEGPISARADGTGAVWRPEGPEAALLEPEWILVDRRPRGGVRTVVATWPGSLGGCAGASERGLAVAVSGRPVEEGREGLKGPPFLASVRLALEEGRGALDAYARLSRTTAHEVVVLEPAASRAWRGVLSWVEFSPPLPLGADDAPVEGLVRLRWSGGWTVEAGAARSEVPASRDGR